MYWLLSGTCIQSTGFIHLTVSEETIFYFFPQNFALYGTPATNQNIGLGQNSQETIHISAKTKFKCLQF